MRIKNTYSGTQLYEKLEYLQMEYDKISFSSQFSAIPGAQFVLFLKYLTPEPDREKVHEDYQHGEAYVVFIYGQDLSRQEKLIL